MFIPKKDRSINPLEVLNTSPVGTMLLFLCRQTLDSPIEVIFGFLRFKEADL